MKKKLTAEEKAAQEARVAAVQKAIDDAAALRKENGVEETEEETKVREDAEAAALAAAKEDVAPEQNVHTDARDARVAKVKGDIEAAKSARDLAEKVGKAETPGAKMDREAKEAKDLADASVVNVIEPFTVDTNIAEVRLLGAKVSELIDLANKKVG